MYTSPPMITYCARAYDSNPLGSNFNSSAAFHQENHEASMTQIGHESLPEPPAYLSQHSTHNESSAQNSIKQQVLITTCTKNGPKNTQNSLPSTSHQDQSNVHIEAPGTVPPHSLSVIPNAAIESDSSQEDEEQETLPEVAELIATLPRGQITERDVWMQEQIYLSFKRAYDLQQQASKIVDNGYKVPETFLKDDDDKVEIYPKCGFYLPKNVKTLIDFKYEEEHAWNVIVKEVLLAVYGENIVHFSATGKGPKSRPKINTKLFNGLLAWINHGKVGEELVDRKKLINEINHISSNKRGYQKTKQAKK
ncbi:uncharacterized protein LOC141528153 [Cotesia typhae]|uniref:uncharacterized protein LOC141528153 n=1 Tax=Cotesia typhae TaxID=2053667 RepID=UPI003D694F3B